jgi:putative transposase
MARLPRLELAGQVHLVVQSGREGRKVLADDEDRRNFSEALAFCARRWGVLVHAYALTDSRALLMVTPGTQGCLGRMMQQLNRRFTGAVNSRTAQQGPVWNGRYQATVVEAGPSVLTAMRYVEWEPVAEGVAAGPLDWAWSSAGHHAGTRVDPLIAHHASYWQLGNTPFDREAQYRRLLELPVAANERAHIESRVRGGWPLGSEAFVRSLHGRTARRLAPGRRGRPSNPVPNKVLVKSDS